MLMIFSNFVLWYPSMIIHCEQYILMIYVMTQLAGKETIFNHLAKFYNLISIAYCWKQGYPLADKYIPKVISGHNKIRSLFIMKLLLNVNLYTWSSFISHVICLGKTSSSWYKYTDPFKGRKFWILHAFKIQFFPVSILW